MCASGACVSFVLSTGSKNLSLQILKPSDTYLFILVISLFLPRISLPLSYFGRVVFWNVPTHFFGIDVDEKIDNPPEYYYLI